jgi:hypothetical protein
MTVQRRRFDRVVCRTGPQRTRHARYCFANDFIIIIIIIIPITFAYTDTIFIIIFYV